VTKQAGEISRTADRESPCQGNQQSGIALIVVLVLVGLLIGTLVIGFTGDLARQNRKQQQTTEALAKAKEALIGYAAKDPNKPGVLPCPDSNNDGSADSPCGAIGVTAIGRLPWRTLRLSDLRDGSGECLWYAVSANFKDSGTSAPAIVNSDSPGTLVINDAPGDLVLGQDRTPSSTTVCGGNTTAANYLEGGNQNGAATNIFVTAQATNTFNDKLLPITSNELFSVVEMRVLHEMRNALVIYRSNNPYFPFANLYTDPTYSCNPGASQGRLPLNIGSTCPGLGNWGPELPAWFFPNYWQNVTYYAVSQTGNLSVDGNPSVTAVVFTAGSAIAALGQNRPCASVSDCLEGPENTNGDNVFVSPVRSATTNDRLLIVSP
jgi:type II secretory pathway pseudopilin PulG